MSTNALNHIFKSARYSMAGLGVLLREQAARLELLSLVASFTILLLLGGRVSDYLVVGILFCLVLAVEALNTAVEALVDKISPERSDFAREAKDLGSLAVFFILLAIGLYLTAVLARSLGWLVW